MATSLSEDLRLQVIRAVDGGMSRNAAARRFKHLGLRTFVGAEVSVPDALPEHGYFLRFLIG